MILLTLLSLAVAGCSEVRIGATGSKAGLAPHFAGTPVFAVQPRMPLVFAAAAAGGQRPMVYFAKNLPAGLSLDPKTGIVAGSLAREGDFSFKVTAKNPAGRANTDIKIKCAALPALTPPMGWNSYDSFGDSVTEEETLANARYKPVSVLTIDTNSCSYRGQARILELR